MHLTDCKNVVEYSSAQCHFPTATNNLNPIRQGIKITPKSNAKVLGQYDMIKRRIDEHMLRIPHNKSVASSL